MPSKYYKQKYVNRSNRPTNKKVEENAKEDDKS